MTEPSAEVIADSISSSGHRLTTIEVTLHRFVLAEFNTHRAFSRNSASSRAIPVAREVRRITEEPASPVEWPAERPGMQGGEPLAPDDAALAEAVWNRARTEAIAAAEDLRQIGVHKSVTNRLLEPFMWQTIIVSSTEWENFWSQRCSPLAQPEIRLAAEAMRAALGGSVPQLVLDGEWHLPYIQPDEEFSVDDAKKVSAARCARVSYLTHDGKRDIVADLTLFERLVSAKPAHASPLEHVATPSGPAGKALGNFTGWHQLRHDALATE